MPFPVNVVIDEADVAATLKLVLQEVVKQNKVCTVLIKSSVEHLGTQNARVVLTFDGAKCEKVKPVP